MSVVTNTTTIGAIDAPSRRNTELALVAFAVLISVFAYANVGLALHGELPAGMLGYGLGLALLGGVAHLAVRRFAPYADPLLLPLATLLNGLGLAIIWRLDQSERFQALKTFAPAASKQLMFSAVGVALMVVVLVALKDHRILQRYTYISMLVALFLLILPMFFPAVNGAKIWIKIPGVGTIQPGEFAKIIIAVFFAGYLMVKRDALALASRRFMGLYLPRGRDLGPILMVWAFSILILVFETDLGSSLLFFGMFVVMLYVATERTSWIVFGLLMSGAGCRRRDVRAARPGPCHRLARPLRGVGQGGGERADGQVAHGLRLRRHPRHRARPGQLRPDRLRRELRLHPRHRRRGARTGRDDGRPARLRSDRRTRGPYRARRPGPLRQAPRDRPLRLLRHPGLRRRRMVSWDSSR